MTNVDLSDIKVLQVARAKCDKDLMFFTRFFFKILRGQKFIQNWHHVEINEALTGVAEYKYIFANFNLPPRHSKTEFIINFIAQNLGKNPNGNYLYITASDDLRSETSTRIRDIVTNPIYKQMYGVELKADQNAKNLWRTKQGGGLKTATIFGQITGFGAGQMIDHNSDLEDFIREFEGCIILDDINKIADSVANNVNAEKVIARLFDTILSRKNSEDTPIINIQQRTALNDASAVLLKHFGENNPKVKNLILPIIIDGKPLWEWKHSLEDIERLKISPETKGMFNAQYMQDPRTIEGAIFPEFEMQKYKSLPTEIINQNGKDIEVLQGWTISVADTADEGDNYFSMPIAQVVPPYVFVFDAIFDQNNLTVQESQVDGKVKLHKIRKIVIETNSFGAYFQRRMRTNLKGVEIFGQWSKGNKMGRILSYSGIIKTFFRFPENPTPELEKFMNQVYKILKTSTKEDDAPDSLAILAEHLEKFYGMFK